MKKPILFTILLPFLLTFNSVQAQWSDVSTPYPYALTSASFLDDDHGFVISDGYPMMLATTNGGASWDSIIINTGVGAIDIDFISIDTGFVLVDSLGITMLKTTFNGGASWTSDTLPAGDTYQMMRFTSISTGYVTSIFGFVYKTTNSGQNWTQLPLGAYSGATDKEYTGTDTIIFTGWDGTFSYRGSVISSVNTGISFQEHIVNTDYSQFNGTHFTSGANGFAVFYNGFPNYDNYFIHTSNGGTSWDTILIDTASANVFTDVLMTSATTGYITNQTGPTSTILKVTGGTTTVDFTFGNALKRIYKAGNKLYAIGEAGKVVKLGLPLGLEPNSVIPLEGIYPNPSAGIIFIPIESVSDIIVLDMTGKVVLSKKLFPGEPLYLGELANGMYCIQVKNEKGIAAGRILFNK